MLRSYRKSGHKNSLLVYVGRLFIARPSECKVPQNYGFYPKLPNFFGKKLLTYTIFSYFCSQKNSKYYT